MDDPPLVDGQSSKEPEEFSDYENPYAPEMAVNPTLSSDGVDYPALGSTYWIFVVVTVICLLGSAYFIPGFAIPAALAITAGAIRVPLIRRRLSAHLPARPLPNPFAMIATSSVFMLIAGMAACFCFAIVCVPGGFMLYSYSTNSMDNGFIALVVVSGLIGLAAFVGLFYLSLKLPV